MHRGPDGLRVLRAHTGLDCGLQTVGTRSARGVIKRYDPALVSMGDGDTVRIKGVLNITKHAEQRYAERIMQYDSKAKVEQYVAANHDVIRESLTKLLDSAEEIYTGSKGDKGELTVLITDRFVLIVNKKKNNLVTLFKVQAVTDEEDDFNGLYFAHMIGNIRARIRECETLTRETEDEITERVEAQIKDHEQEIERLTRLRDSYQTIVDSLRDDVDSADMRVKHAVEDLVKAKVF